MISWSQVIKKGNNDHPSWLLIGFRDVVRDYELIDLPLEGYQFTWGRSEGTVNMVEERIDRALVTSSWLDL